MGPDLAAKMTSKTSGQMASSSSASGVATSSSHESPSIKDEEPKGVEDLELNDQAGMHAGSSSVGGGESARRKSIASTGAPGGDS